VLQGAEKLSRKMYYILTYDITSPKRLPKALKLCRRFLNHVQNSVFEGELTTAQMQRLETEMKKLIDKNQDSVLIYTARTPEVVDRIILGIEKNEISYFL
jgi:CRISPR-associated protein Cas2